MTRSSLAFALFAVLAFPAACGGSSSDSGGGSGGSAGHDAAADQAGAAGFGGSAGVAGGATGGNAGSPSGGGGGIDLDGAVLEGSLDALSCTPNTADSECSTFPQCGCAVGEKCDVIGLDTGHAACVADGTAQSGQGCSTLFVQCVAGLACVGGACKQFCASVADCPGAGRECVQTEVSQNGQPFKVPGMFTCTSGCDPVNPGLVCGSGITCLFSSATATDCYAAGSGVGPGACGPNQGLACAPGTICIDTTAQNGTYSCLEWCRISANDCPANFSCKELNTKPTLAGVEYGACFAN